MECFNDLLLKLQEVHEREVEGWQVKVQELSNKKGCDTKRMEELFTRNQQMKEQQRLLTENIKTLENRLRAGLCDRCTVTQEVAKKKQQEFEAYQMQSYQHIARMVGDVNNLKMENKRLRDEIRNLRTALEDHATSILTTPDFKPNSSPDLSPSSSGPTAPANTPTSRTCNQPPEGNLTVKTETEQRNEETEHRHSRGTNRAHLESYNSRPHHALPTWKNENSGSRGGERRSVDGVDQRSSLPTQALHRSSSSSAAGGEVKPSRHVLHAPVPCRPQPIKSGSVSLPWPLSESSDWVTVASAGTNLATQAPTKLNMIRFPNLIPTSQQPSLRRQSLGSSSWQKQNAPQPQTKEPTVVLRLKSLKEPPESQTKPPEKKENPPPKPERVSSGEAPRDPFDGPLDLSDRGKSKPNQTPKDDSALALVGLTRVRKNPDMDVSNSSAFVPVSSPVIYPSSSCTPPDIQEQEPTSDQDHKMVQDQEQKEEVNGKTEQSNGKKVPVLTISLRPVVLESLNSALQKQESLASNDKSLSLSPADEPGSSSAEADEDDDESESGRDSNRGGSRKRPRVETDSDGHSGADTGSIHQDRKIKIAVRAEEKSSS
ncbi:RBBP8 N-terminal-like protein isoform X2 [Mugil cephalus]|uniref:RBBP8 N-terminal-like protein isoform X2 n=1 Tax=Mugil cephalus TaxID=48193 RepID=UPI001FB6E4C9|nr:RBBP8 N-terminal-like protein isoform X2 [Mugil cephalus]